VDDLGVGVGLWGDTDSGRDQHLDTLCESLPALHQGRSGLIMGPTAGTLSIIMIEKVEY
jgi:hypothetical protein